METNETNTPKKDLKEILEYLHNKFKEEGRLGSNKEDACLVNPIIAKYFPTSRNKANGI